MFKSMILGITGVIVFAVSALAQSGTGTLEGHVLDSASAAVPGAAITIENQNTGVKLSTVSNATGSFIQLYLIPGEYRLAVEKPGFERYVASDIRIAVQQSVNLEVPLKVGSVSTSVEVSANVVQLSTSNATVSTVINQQMLIDLPNGRNPFSLASLSPGVSPSGGTSTNPSISGGRGGSNEITIDGTTVIVPENNVGTNDLGYQPIMDSIEEVTIITNSMAAEFGRTGGGFISVASKSGTNKIHGSLFEFNRNQIYDANSWSNNRQGTPKGPVRQNVFGGSVGGPVWLPKLYNGRNRTFFFFTEQSTVRHNSSSGSSTVPTDAWKSGNFAGLKNGVGADITLFDPSNTLCATNCGTSAATYQRVAFPGNQISPLRFDSVAKNMLKFYPEPTPGAFITNQYTLQNNYFRQGSAVNNDNRIDTRVDHNVTSAFRMWARGSWSNNPNPGFNLWGNPGTGGSGPNYSTNYNIAFNAVYTLSPSTILNVNYGFARKIADRDPFSQGMDLAALGFPAAVVQAAAEQNLEFPNITMGGNQSLTGLGQATFTTLRIHGYDHEWKSDVTKILNKHAIKFGAQFRKLYLNFRQNGQPSGQYNFSNSLWTQQNVSSNTSTTQGTGFAAFLLGLPNPNTNGGSNAGGTLEHTYAAAESSGYVGFFLQDEWKVSTKLTLNIGLRWDADIPRTERYNRLSYFDINTPSSIDGKVPLLPGRKLMGAMKFVSPDHRRQVPTDLNNFGPRFGFAWQFAPKSVFRGAYSVLYGGSIMQAAGTSGSSGTLGFTSSTGMNSSFDNGLTIVGTLSNPFPNGFNRPLGPIDGPTSGVNTNLGLSVGGGDGTVFTDWVNPMIQQWSGTIQREIPGKFLIEAGYLGASGHHLIDNESSGASLNQLPGSYMALGTQLTTLVNNPFRGIIQGTSGLATQTTVSYNQLLREFPQYTGVDGYRKPGANSIYHGFTLSAQKRYTHGLQLQVSYTDAKQIDDSSSSPQGGGSGGSKQDVFNRQSDRSLSASDIRQRLVISGDYNLPFGKGRSWMTNAPRAVDAVFGGWQFNGIYTLQTGQPLQFSSGLPNNTGIFSPGQRLNSTGKSAKKDGPIVDRLNAAFDTSVFTAPANFTFGNLGRVSPDVRGPHTNTADLSLFKAFRIIEGVSLRVQAEAYSALNHPIWGSPGTTMNNLATFGVITSKNSNNRTGQMALRLTF